MTHEYLFKILQYIINESYVYIFKRILASLFE